MRDPGNEVTSRSGKGLTLETSASLSFHNGNLTLHQLVWNQFFLFHLPLTRLHSFVLNCRIYLFKCFLLSGAKPQVLIYDPVQISLSLILRHFGPILNRYPGSWQRPCRNTRLCHMSNSLFNRLKAKWTIDCWFLRKAKKKWFIMKDRSCFLS